MPSLCGLSWIDEIDQAIGDRAAAYGLPLDIAYAFVAAESGFFSYSSSDTYGYEGDGSIIVGDDGHRGMVTGAGIAWESYYHPGRFDCSHGLLMLNACGGQGAGLSWSQLVSPWINCDVGFQPIAIAFRNCWSANVDQQTYIRCIMRNSGHPGNVPDGNPVFEAAFNNLWPKWSCFYQSLIGQPPPNPTPPPVPPLPTPPLPNPIPNNPPPAEEGSQGSILLAAGFLALSAYLLATRTTILKKVVINKPSGQIKILKSQGIDKSSKRLY